MKAYSITIALAFVGSLAALAIFTAYHKRKHKTADLPPAIKPTV